MRTAPLYLEDRVSIAREMLNEMSRRELGVEPGKDSRARTFVLRLMGVLEGHRFAVPKRYRARVGRRGVR